MSQMDWIECTSEKSYMFQKFPYLSGSYLPVSEDDKLGGGEFFHPHGTKGMEL